MLLPAFAMSKKEASGGSSQRRRWQKKQQQEQRRRWRRRRRRQQRRAWVSASSRLLSCMSPVSSRTDRPAAGPGLGMIKAQHGATTPKPMQALWRAQSTAHHRLCSVPTPANQQPAWSGLLATHPLAHPEGPAACRNWRSPPRPAPAGAGARATTDCGSAPANPNSPAAECRSAVAAAITTPDPAQRAFMGATYTILKSDLLITPLAAMLAPTCGSKQQQQHTS